jgi:hypothetical protein
MKDQLAATGGRINVFLQTLEPDTVVLQVRDDLEQVPERAPQPVEFPAHEHIACAHGREHLLQDGTLDAGATDDLLIDLPAAGLPDRVTLGGKALFLRAPPGISDLHAGFL